MSSPLEKTPASAGTDPERLSAIVGALIRDEPALGGTDVFGPFVRQGDGPRPSVLIGDQVSIPLYRPEDVAQIDYRMALLAEPGDLVVVRERDPSFEAYLAAYPGIAGVDFLEAHAEDPMPVARQCLTDPMLAERLSGRLAAAGGLTIKPYLTTGHVWRLARHLGETAERPVHVAGPGPRLSRRANDKLWFCNLVRRIVGPSGVPPTYSAFGPSAAAARVARLARTAESVIVKVPGSAGSAGNVRIPSQTLRGVGLREVRALLDARLRAAGWRAAYPLLVGVWENGVLASPSAQTWIPRRGTGAPVVDGVFEQRVDPRRGAFLGAVQADLDPETEAAFRGQAADIATVLQGLGYFGRCSFDAVLKETGRAGPELHWIECNARWGGVSIPLAAPSRLWPGAGECALAIVQDAGPEGAALDVEEMVRRLDDLLFRREAAAEGVVILSPPASRARPRINLMALADTTAQAEDMVRAAWARLVPPGGVPPVGAVPG